MCSAAEDVVVEAVLAEQQLVHPAQELAGLRALDDAVVVRAGQGDGLADRRGAARVSSEAPENSAGYSIAPTPMIAPAPCMSRGTECTVPMPPGLVRLIVVPWKSSVVSLPCAGPAHDVLVRREELREVHPVGVADRRDDERAGAVGVLQVDGEARGRPGRA